uniref:Uncharacterized protein n=1 Tax=Tanacetum cinerariifolium TaxID=118510 RepID=A0A6L2NZM3_TANCI|nr:hypothetical protein [Tanacetum cinerariifolium]
MWSQAPVSYDKYALWGISHWRHKHQQFYGFAVDRESARDVYSKRRIIAVIELQIVKWHNYKHLDWIIVRRDDDKLYKFKEAISRGFAFRILKTCVESYQKKLNLTKPDTYRSDLKRKEAYTAYSNLRGFIYQNKDKQNRSILTDSQVTPTKHGRMTKPYLSPRFIAKYFNEEHIKMEVKENGLITFTDETKEITFKTPYKDLERSELSSEGHDLLSSRVTLSEEDYDRGCRKPSDLEYVFYRDTIKLGSKYMIGMDDEGEVMKFLIKNKEEIFTDAGDDIRIYPDGVASPAM